MNYKEFIDNVWVWFKNTPQFALMQNTVENSPWHREDNVAVHTIMVAQQYTDRQPIESWTHDDLLCYLACVFHDVGKPACEQIKESAERGVYRSYGGHEQYSACVFMDMALTNWTLFSTHLTVYDLFCVSWLTQYHLPYKLGKDKLLNLVNTLPLILNNPNKFKDILIADQMGRISDTHEENERNMLKWFEEQFDPLVTEIIPITIDHTKPTCYVLTGASGSGKSTYTEEVLINNGLIDSEAVFSYDRIRVDLFSNDVEAQSKYQQSDFEGLYIYVRTKSINEGKAEFTQRINEEFSRFVNSNKSFVIDNMNLTSKTYRKYTSIAKQKGYNVIHIIFPIALEKLLERSRTRGNRGIPDGVIKEMYHRLVLPTINKYCDNIIVVDKNV